LAEAGLLYRRWCLDADWRRAPYPQKSLCDFFVGNNDCGVRGHAAVCSPPYACAASRSATDDAYIKEFVAPTRLLSLTQQTGVSAL
jgi:hypothetical protein